MRPRWQGPRCNRAVLPRASSGLPRKPPSPELRPATLRQEARTAATAGSSRCPSPEVSPQITGAGGRAPALLLFVENASCPKPPPVSSASFPKPPPVSSASCQETGWEGTIRGDHLPLAHSQAGSSPAALHPLLIHTQPPRGHSPAPPSSGKALTSCGAACSGTVGSTVG